VHDDIRILEADEGLSRFLSEIEDHGRTSSERRALKLRWRKKQLFALLCLHLSVRSLEKIPTRNSTNYKELGLWCRENGMERKSQTRT